MGWGWEKKKKFGKWVSVGQLLISTYPGAVRRREACLPTDWGKPVGNLQCIPLGQPESLAPSSVEISRSRSLTNPSAILVSTLTEIHRGRSRRPFGTAGLKPGRHRPSGAAECCGLMADG